MQIATQTSGSLTTDLNPAHVEIDYTINQARESGIYPLDKIQTFVDTPQTWLFVSAKTIGDNQFQINVWIRRGDKFIPLTPQPILFPEDRIVSTEDILNLDTKATWPTELVFRYNQTEARERIVAEAISRYAEARVESRSGTTIITLRSIPVFFKGKLEKITLAKFCTDSEEFAVENKNLTPSKKLE